MIKLLILSLLATLLMAQNPKVYSILGDVVYSNVAKIEKLKEIPSYSKNKRLINIYVKEVSHVKAIGFDIQNGSSKIDKETYLKKIRNLAKTNDFFHRAALNSFQNSLIKSDSELFSVIVNSGLIHTNRYRSDILHYYNAHIDDINSTGVIQTFLDEEKELKLKNEKKNEKNKKRQVAYSKKKVQEDKIKRLRQNDIKKEKALEEHLEKELLNEKSEIRKEQLEELSQ